MISVIWSFTPGPTDLTRLLRDPWSLELFEILSAQKFPSGYFTLVALVTLVIPGQPGHPCQTGHSHIPGYPWSWST